MLQIEKLVRLGQPVPLLAAFPFQISTNAQAAPPEPMGFVHNARRDYSTCTSEESVGGFLSKSKNDVKKDD